MMDGSTSGMFFGGGVMWIFWILLIILVVVGVKGLGGGDSNRPSNNDSPMDILKKRYANGEIGEEEFERRRKELEN